LAFNAALSRLAPLMPLRRIADMGSSGRHV
jgi:hypothetical protein